MNKEKLFESVLKESVSLEVMQEAINMLADIKLKKEDAKKIFGTMYQMYIRSGDLTEEERENIAFCIRGLIPVE